MDDPPSGECIMPERRRELRQRALRSGRIVFNSRRSVIDCVVRNLSDGGACLQVNGVGGIPVTFDLMVDGFEPDFACQMIWASETRIGVEFSIAAIETGPAQTPRAADAEAENHSGAQHETIYR
jgi:hypothetical protein